PNKAKTNFLAIFEWSSRKAWDVLLAAYLREFSAQDDVCLYLRTYLFSKPDGDPSTAIWNLIKEHADKLGLGDKPWPRIHLIAHQIPQADLPRLYKAVDCLVAPSRGEGWGRPHHEAMFMGLPVIATNWSGNTEFMNQDNSFLLDYELQDTKYLEPELLHYRKQRWANPSEDHLRQTMRLIVQKPELARAKGQKARAHILAQYTREAVARIVVERLKTIEKKISTPICPAVVARNWQVAPEFPELVSDSLHVAWEGSFLDFGSLSQVNRQLTEPLARTAGLQLHCLGKNILKPALAAIPELQQMARRLKTQPHPKTQITVRHGWPPRWDPPAQGKWVVIQPWEFGVLPAEWVAQLAHVDEAWVPSEYVRRVYVESGVHPSKVKVVPNGINPQLYHPAAAPMKLATSKKFKFLFVGGTIARKGPDILLKAYLQRFTAADDVCLVIKDFGGQDVYAGQTIEAQIKAAQQQPNAPEILYLTSDLTPAQMAGLYTACDCLVHPYRGEGFGLPVLEAMACGLPVIVTAGGSTDDFATDEFAYRVPARRKIIGPVIAEMPLVRAGWWLEPSVDHVAMAMREVFAYRESARERGRKASEFVHQHWTWERAAAIAAQHLKNLHARDSHAQQETRARRLRRLETMELPAAGRVGELSSARTFLKQDKLAEAWNAGCTAVQSRPFHPDGYLLLAEIARKAGDPGKARQCLDRLRQMTPRWKAAQHFPPYHPKNGSQNLNLRELPAASAPNAQRISVCLITKNEEKFIGKCLESVQPIASQIIIVDTGSTDWTVDIAKRYGAEVYTFNWSDDFSAARNAVLERATGDWVLVIDADEELTPEGREIIRKEIAAPNVLAYRLPIIDSGREADGCSYVPRLFRNAPAVFYVGRIHEQAFTSLELLRAEWNMENCLGTATLLHHGYTPELMRSRNKKARNLLLLEKAVEEMPNEPNL
ncbi:MAG TPA: glycosyltransferase, partial [Verrucomicrobiae bacterium]